MKILILKPSSLGDVIHALPVLRLIKGHIPEAEIFWMIEKGLAPLLEGDPDLAGLVPFDRKGWVRPRNWHHFANMIRWIRDQRFDWVIDLQSLARSGSVAWLANAGLTVGLDERREGARGFYDLAARRSTWHTHAVDWYLSVLPFLGVPRDRPYDWIPRRAQVAEGLEIKFGIQKHRWIVLQPGARWANKRWPERHFAELASRLQRLTPEHRVAILGGREDADLGSAIAQASPSALDLTGKLNLQEMIEWIRASDLMITNDTGPMHVAAAVGCRVIALFGPTEPLRTGPYGQNENVLRLELPCVPCMKPRCRNSNQMQCLRELQPSMVMEKVSQVLSLANVR